jgi:hypothetical protein
MLKTKYALMAFSVFFVFLLLPNEASAGLKCSRLIKTPSGEQLINTCGSCRIVKIQRKRPGADAPTNRTYTVPPKTTTDLSFRGPGRSRVLSDSSCRPNAADGAETKATSPPGKRCILMQRVKKAGITGLALANTCNECRTAIVDRIDASGSRRSQTVVISGRSVISLPAKGAAQAGIMSEKPCN